FGLAIDHLAGDQVVFEGRIAEHEASALFFQLLGSWLRRFGGSQKSFEIAAHQYSPISIELRDQAWIRNQLDEAIYEPVGEHSRKPKQLRARDKCLQPARVELIVLPGAAHEQSRPIAGA